MCSFWNSSCRILQVTRKIGSGYNSSDSGEEDPKDFHETRLFFRIRIHRTCSILIHKIVLGSLNTPTGISIGSSLISVHIPIFSIGDTINIHGTITCVDKATNQHVKLGKDQKNQQSFLNSGHPIHTSKSDDQEENQSRCGDDPDIIIPTSGHSTFLLSNHNAIPGWNHIGQQIQKGFRETNGISGNGNGIGHSEHEANRSSQCWTQGSGNHVVHSTSSNLTIGG